MSQNVEIEPLRTYVVISLQLTALFQGHSLAILIYLLNFLVVSTTLDVSLLTSFSHLSHISNVYSRLYPQLSAMVYTHSHYPQSSLITCNHHSVVPEHFLVQSTSAYVTLSVCHQLCEICTQIYNHGFNCHFSSIYSYHSHYVIIIFKP